MKNYKQGILYLFFGALTTAVNIISYYASYNIFKISNVTSTILAWALAVLFAFVTNRIFVFESKEKKSFFKELWLFYLSRGLTMLLEVGAMWLFVDICLFNDWAVKIIANIVIILLNYVVSKFIVFKKDNKEGAEDKKENEDLEK